MPRVNEREAIRKRKHLLPIGLQPGVPRPETWVPKVEKRCVTPGISKRNGGSVNQQKRDKVSNYVGAKLLLEGVSIGGEARPLEDKRQVAVGIKHRHLRTLQNETFDFQ